LQKGSRRQLSNVIIGKRRAIVGRHLAPQKGMVLAIAKLARPAADGLALAATGSYPSVG
jgi:hypothetical protein